MVSLDKFSISEGRLPVEDEVVSTLEEYLTAMSMGKPHVLKEFLLTSLVPW